MAEPTYIFKDGHVYTMVDGKVVASVKEAEFEPGAGAEGLEMPEAPEDIQGPGCPGCGMPTEPQDLYCPNCGTALGEGGGPEFPEPAEDLYGAPSASNGIPGQMIAQTVETPNGLKGRVLARVPSLWGEEVTVRFENGNIRRLPVDERMTFAAAEEKPAATAAQSLEERLAASYEHDRMSLVERGRELKKIERTAAACVRGASDGEAVNLSRVATQARYELAEVTAALAAINEGEVEAFEAPAPIRSLPQVSQASTGGGDSSWLEGVHAAMVSEANDTDYTKLMDEGPEAFVASLTPDQLADTGTTRVMALREIESKVAGADEAQQDAYRRMWLARVEMQRKAALTSHKDEVAEKTAATDTPDSPDESLFLK